jgi:dTDP-4-amino-4,6-dideoxygalactose transaminase
MTHRIPLLDLKREHAEIAGEIDAAWREALAGMQLLGGRAVQAFEREIAAYLGVAFARGVSSGTDALLLGMEAVGVGPGDRVILPANAFVAALEAVRHLGAEPVLVDTAPDGFAPDAEAIAAALPARAVLVVHLYGHAFDVAAIRAACDLHGAVLVEDGSHAHGARRDGRTVGSFGAVGCFSAGVVKNLGAYGDAGFIATSDPAVADAVDLLRHHGQRSKGNHARYGYNARLDELQAVVLRVKLRRLDARNRRRAEIAAYYRERFSGLDLRLPRQDADEIAVYHQYVLRSSRRDELQRHLDERGVQTGIHYPIPLHRQDAWIRAYGNGFSFPRAERLASEVLSIPVFPDLNDAEVEEVANAVRSFFIARPRPVTSRSDRPRFSVVVPVYNEQDNVGPLHREIDAVMASLGPPYEIVFVDDGSTDATRERLAAIVSDNDQLRILELDGNFGEAAALSAGFHHARGEIVVTLDGDGQNDPADIPRLVEVLERTGVRAVSGRREQRQEGFWLRVLPSRVANALIAKVTGVPVYDCGCGLKAYRKAGLLDVHLPRGMNRFLPAILGVGPSEVAEVPTRDRKREHGASHYGFRRTLVVLRDLLALRFLVRNPLAAQIYSSLVTATVAAAGAILWRRSVGAALPFDAGAALCGLVWWNARRFNRAQIDGVYVVRTDTGAEPRAGSEAARRAAT